MKRIAICLFAFVWLFAATAHGKNAMEYFDLGLKSSMTYKKIEYFTKALELNPKLTDAYAKRGMLYYFQEKYDKMILDFKTYIKHVPATSEAYHMLGVGYLKTGCFAEAVSNFTRAIAMDAFLVSAYAHRAEAYRLDGKYEEAICDATRAIKMWGDPLTMSDVLRTRAKAYWKIDRKTEAYADNKRSLHLDPRANIFWKTFPPVEDLRCMGLLYLIGIAFVFIFRLKLKSPPKKSSTTLVGPVRVAAKPNFSRSTQIRKIIIRNPGQGGLSLMPSCTADFYDPKNLGMNYGEDGIPSRSSFLTAMICSR